VTRGSERRWQRARVVPSRRPCSLVQTLLREVVSRMCPCCERARLFIRLTVEAVLNYDSFDGIIWL
jgi:hypothetical protein